MKPTSIVLSILYSLFAGSFAKADLPPILTQQKCACSFEGVKITTETYDYYRSQGEFSSSYWRDYFRRSNIWRSSSQASTSTSHNQSWDNESESSRKYAYISAVKLRKYIVYLNVNRKPQLLEEEISSFVANSSEKRSAIALCNADVKQLKTAGICE